MVSICFFDSIFQNLLGALKWDGRERAAIILCHSSRWQNDLKLLSQNVIMPKERNYQDRSAGHYGLKREFVDDAINIAVKEQCDIILCHIHPHGIGAHFSGIDDNCEDKFFSSLFDQIEGMNYGSLVFSNDLNKFEGRIWKKNGKLKTPFIPVSKITVLGQQGFQVLLPDNPKYPNYSDFIFQIKNCKLDEIFNNLSVGVIGCSGSGSPLAEMLARLGTGRIKLCDADDIEEKNLNRMQGVTPDDVGKNKAIYYKEYLGRVCPNTVVDAFSQSFYESDVQKAFSQTDVVFGCVDSGVRHSINRLAFANLIPYYDIGVGINEDKESLNFIGYQIYRLFPGQPICLKCSGAFSELWSDFINPQEYARNLRQGYISSYNNASKVFSPPLYYLNMQAAAKAIEMFLYDLFLFPKNNLKSEKSAFFRVECNRIRKKEYPFFYSPQGTNRCSVCSNSGALGKGDKIPFLVPDQSESNISIPQIREGKVVEEDCTTAVGFQDSSQLSKNPRPFDTASKGMKRFHFPIREETPFSDISGGWRKKYLSTNNEPDLGYHTGGASEDLNFKNLVRRTLDSIIIEISNKMNMLRNGFFKIGAKNEHTNAKS